MSFLRVKPLLRVNVNVAVPAFRLFVPRSPRSPPGGVFLNVFSTPEPLGSFADCHRLHRVRRQQLPRSRLPQLQGIPNNRKAGGVRVLVTLGVLLSVDAFSRFRKGVLASRRRA